MANTQLPSTIWNNGKEEDLYPGLNPGSNIFS